MDQIGSDSFASAKSDRETNGLSEVDIIDPARERVWFALGAAFPGILLAVLAVASRLGHSPYHDEKLYLPVALEIGQGSSFARLITYEGIHVVAGPAIFLIYGSWLQVIGGGLPGARALSVLLATLAGIFLVSIGRRVGISRPVLLAMGLIALPHFLLTGLGFLSEPLTLSLSMMGIWLWLRGIAQAKTAWIWFAAIPLAIAADVRLPTLAVPIALCISGKITIQRSAAFISPALAVAAQLPLWFIWGGVTPPTRDIEILAGVEPTAGIHIDTLLHMITIAGFCFWPALRRPRLRSVAWSLLGLIIYSLWKPDMGPRFLGPLRALTSPIGKWPAHALLLASFLAGWDLIARIVLQFLDTAFPASRRTMNLLALSGIGIYIMSPLAFDRYSLTFTPFWLLSMAPVLESGLRIRVWAIWLLVMIGIVYMNLSIFFGLIHV